MQLLFIATKKNFRKLSKLSKVLGKLRTSRGIALETVRLRRPAGTALASGLLNCPSGIAQIQLRVSAASLKQWEPEPNGWRLVFLSGTLSLASGSVMLS